MPHIARSYAPGTIQHVYSRFVSREFRFDVPGARDDYLRRLGIAVERTDWKLIAYALMSSHPHLAFIAGHDPLSRVLRSLNSGFARWLNRREGRSGAVFESRASNVIATGERSGRLIAYIHNNPVRAGLVTYAGDSSWSSHRAYCDARIEPPRWLHVTAGLELSGFDATPEGRAGFDALVRARANDPRDPTGCAEAVRAARVAIRRLLGAGVEAEGVEADIGTGRVELGVRIPPGAVLRPRWGGDLVAVVEKVAREARVEPDAIRSRTQARQVVAARRLAVYLITRELGRTVTEAAAVVGLTLSGASRLLNREVDADRREALLTLASSIADECWTMTG
jgi:hypothetical protein